MDGSLALVGSGEYLPAMTSFEKSLLDDGIKNGKEAHYIQIPTAAGRESDDRLAYWRELGQGQADAIGVKATFLPIFTREDAFKQEHVDAIANSARLGIAATAVGVSVGLGIGIFAALRPGGKRDVAVNTVAFVGISVPPYISAILLQLVFAVYWSKWFGNSLFPTSGVYPPGQDGFDLVLMIKHMALPTVVVAIQVIAVYSRYMRSSLLDVLNSDYMRTARSKGLSEFRILMRHGVRNALIPVITIAALDIGAIVGGLIITENIFDYPGTGKYFLSAFGNGDFPLLMPLMVIIVASVLLFNLLADISYAVLDPRIRLD